MYYAINYFIYGNSCGCNTNSITEKFVDLRTFIKLIKEKVTTENGRFEIPLNTKDLQFKESSNNKIYNKLIQEEKILQERNISQEEPFSEQALAMRRKKYNVKDESIFNNLSLLELDSDKLPLSEITV